MRENFFKLRKKREISKNEEKKGRQSLSLETDVRLDLLADVTMTHYFLTWKITPTHVVGYICRTRQFSQVFFGERVVGDA